MVQHSGLEVQGLSAGGDYSSANGLSIYGLHAKRLVERFHRGLKSFAGVLANEDSAVPESISTARMKTIFKWLN